MRRKIGVALTVFALAFGTAAGVSSAENEFAMPGEAAAIAGQSHMAMQGTAWVAERPNKFRRWVTFAWGVETRAEKKTNQWVHIAIPTPTYIDDTQQRVFHLEFCAKAENPLMSAPKAVHIWANQNRIYEENITWPNQKGEYCHKIDFSPRKWMESVGVSVLVKYDNRKDKVTLTKAWIATLPKP